MKARERFLRLFFRSLLRVFFKRISVIGPGTIPADGPLILAANHVNSLLDPLILLVVSPRPVRFLAKAPLFRQPVVAPFLRLLRVLPVERRQDEGSDMARNEALFQACGEGLLHGEALALFPEGISHNEPALQPVKTGASRILSRALSMGARPPSLVPAGLIYSAKTIFRSDVTVNVGLPVDYSDIVWGIEDDHEAVKTLTVRIEMGLRSLTLNAEKWEDLQFVGQLRGMALESLRISPGEVPDAEAERRMLDKYYLAREERPEELKVLIRRAKTYSRMLGTLHLRDEDVAREVHFRSALAYTWKRLAAMIMGYPAALYGWVFNIVPYALTGPLAKMVAKKEDLVALYKLCIGMGLFLIFYAGGTALLWHLIGIPGLVLMAIAVPSGFFALVYFEMREEFLRTARVVLTLGTRRRTVRRLRAIRHDVMAALEPFIDLYK